MLKLIIEDDEGRKTVVPFVREEITIGRQEGNTIRLTERNVSRRHARLLRSNGAVLVEDLGSYNGVRINGEKIQGRAQINDGDLVQIGDYDLAIQHEGQAQAQPPPPPHAAVEQPPPVPTNGVHTAVTAEHVRPAPIEPEAAPPVPPPMPGGAVPPSRGASTAIIHVDQVEGNRRREVVEIDAAEAPRLVCTNTEFAGREWACVRSELRIGRTEDNDISIDHRSLSRTHAKVVREDNGEWRVLDMQSANGVSVNGEVYAQATLHSGDTVELGHVKLKFLTAGAEYRAPARSRGDDDDDDGPRPRSRMPIVIGAAVVALGGAAAAGYALLNRPPADVSTHPVAVVSPPKPIEPPPAPPPPHVVEAPPQPAVDPAVDAKIDSARQAMAALDFTKAVAVLDALQSSKGLSDAKAKEVQSLLEQSKNEVGFKRHLDDAQAALKAGDPDTADKALGLAEGTVAYAQDRQDLKAKIDAARKPKEPEKPPKPSPVDIATGLSQDAAVLMRARKFDGALFKLKQCVATDETYAECHMLLGATYANLEQPDKGYEEYSIFVKLAPNHPQATKVRALMKAWEESKKHPK